MQDLFLQFYCVLAVSQVLAKQNRFSRNAPHYIYLNIPRHRQASMAREIKKKLQQQPETRDPCDENNRPSLSSNETD